MWSKISGRQHESHTSRGTLRGDVLANGAAGETVHGRSNADATTCERIGPFNSTDSPLSAAFAERADGLQRGPDGFNFLQLGCEALSPKAALVQPRHPLGLPGTLNFTATCARVISSPAAMSSRAAMSCSSAIIWSAPRRLRRASQTASFVIFLRKNLFLLVFS